MYSLFSWHVGSRAYIKIMNHFHDAPLSGKRRENMKTLIKNLLKKVENGAINKNECLEGLLKIGTIDDPNYIDTIMYYLYNKLEESSLTRLNYRSTELDEVYDRDYNCYHWLCESVTVLYDIDCNTFVFIYENELRDIKEMSVKRAPKWFKAGWEGLVAKSLSEEEFNNYYCNLRNNNCFKKVNFELESRDLKGNYLELKTIKSQVKDFLEANPQMSQVIKNVAA